MLLTDKRDRLLFQALHQILVYLIQFVNIHRLQLQAFIGIVHHGGTSIESPALRFRNTFAVQHIATHPLCPKQWSIRVRVIPVFIHFEEVQLFLKHRPDFFLKFCVHRQTKYSVFICPLISVHSKLLFSHSFHG